MSDGVERYRRVVQAGTAPSSQVLEGLYFDLHLALYRPGDTENAQALRSRLQDMQEEVLAALDTLNALLASLPGDPAPVLNRASLLNDMGNEEALTSFLFAANSLAAIGDPSELEEEGSALWLAETLARDLGMALTRATIVDRRLRLERGIPRSES